MNETNNGNFLMRQAHGTGYFISGKLVFFENNEEKDLFF